MNDLNEIKEMYAETQEMKLNSQNEDVKELLREDAELLFSYMQEKDNLDIALKQTNQKITEITEKIRNQWAPFIQGADKASLDMGENRTLTSNTVLNVTVEDDSSSVEWCLENGYKDVLKYQIHNQTMKKIAREHYEKGEMIPGIKYSQFNAVKIK